MNIPQQIDQLTEEIKELKKNKDKITGFLITRSFDIALKNPNPYIEKSSHKKAREENLKLRLEIEEKEKQKEKLITYMRETANF